ncbi:TetR/AcrR family transcriptional regulator [Epibacterium ulvae]|uniref:TetR/AcrR family transcriptional regulator n=1 Tax=Epibacterium ulvae TaxID=1156985 RepID=UPI00249220B9|nr:TetR/AcrR family transcriptional regulator [Epibacterium ulvae]
MARTQGSHSDITGPRIQKVALQLFARHGYAAVSMRQIAKEVGVQVGALYNYLPDKQSLLFSLMNKHMQDVLAAWEERKAILDPCRPDGLLEEFARFHIRFHMARPDAVFIAYMELRNLSPENFAKIEALRKSYEGELQSILDAGVAQRIFTLRDSKITTLAVIAMLNGVMTWYRSGGRLSLEEVEATYWDMVRKAVTG